MSDVIHVATRKGLFTLGRGVGGGGSSVVAAQFLGDHCPMVFHDPRDRTLYAALHHGHFGGKLHRRSVGGSFEEVTAPKYPPKPEEMEDAGAVTATPTPWALKLTWELAAGGESAGDLWCGTIPGGLFRSKDGGETWDLNRPLWDHEGRKRWFGGGADWPGIHSVLQDPRDPSRVIVGVSCGGVWVTEDDGASWKLRAEGMRAEYMPPDQAGDPGTQDPHRVELCRAHPDVLWTQHHNGIFRSTDGSRSWHEIEEAGPSTFGFAVAAHPTDSDTAWFIPGIKDEKRIPVDGKLVVTRTRDGGKTFDVLTEGLPQEHAYDIVFRHGLAVDDTGERLVFGSTTGALFISENGGDSWARANAHLPPIYCVRFGF